MQSEEQKIRELHSSWIKAVNAGDLALLLTLITEDVVFISPGERPVGRDTFTAKFLNSHKELRIHCFSDLEEIVVAGEVAFTRSSDRVSVTSRAGGPMTEFNGHRLTIYRKQSEGHWLLARDVHTLSPKPLV